MKQPSCIISYSHDSNNHKDWVRYLAERLVASGIDVHLDQWDVGAGGDLTKFMETGIRECDFVLLVCTPEYTRKADSREGGVGYETAIVTGAIFDKVSSPEKFVPLLRKGNKKDSIPSYLKGKKFIDFRKDNEFDSSLEELLRHLHDAPKYKRPHLGEKPDFATKESVKNKNVTKTVEKTQQATITEVCEYAHDLLGGMGLSSSGAREFGELWMDKYSDCDFDLFKRVFEYANDALGGMDKPSLGAKEFGLLWVLEYSDCDFNEFKRLYERAHDALGGMDLSSRDAEEFALKHLSKSQEQMPPISSPPVVFKYSGRGSVNTPPFAMDTSPWILEFSTSWSGHFAVQLRDGGIELVINQGVLAGEKYETHVYRHTGSNLYFSILDAPSDGLWTLSIIEVT